MNYSQVKLLGLSFFVLTGSYFAFKVTSSKNKTMLNMPCITTTEQIERLFPKTAEEIEQRRVKLEECTKKDLEQLLNIPSTERTFSNTVCMLDTLFHSLKIELAIEQVLKMVSPDASIREAADQALNKLQVFVLDNIQQSSNIYNVLSAYKNNTKETLSQEQKYALEQLVSSYKRSGLELPEEQQRLIMSIEKERAQLSTLFYDTIARANSTIMLGAQELDGLGQDFFENLALDDNKIYHVPLFKHKYTQIMQECKNSDTRKKVMQTFCNRAYPANEKALLRLIDLNDQLAHILGYKSFAHFDIDNQMAKTPEQVEQFLRNLIKRGQHKYKQELQEIKNYMPAGSKLTPEGKFYPWDYAYVKNHYKKHFSVDETQISHYFPLEHTLDALLNIYEQFFSLNFKKVKKINVWHQDVIMLQVLKNNKLIGNVLLDLHPRENKYTHACQVTLVPGIKIKQERCPALVVVIANFPCSGVDKPALLKRDDVTTFFHEFGHALHAILGATELSYVSGTAVKEDFVEMPSQMLEGWTEDSDILKLISKHYKTGEHLPNDILEKISKLKTFDSAERMRQQIIYALTALELYKSGAKKDIFSLWKTLNSLNEHMIFDDLNHFYCAFEHLIGYGAKYYGYLWSKVFACDLFAFIKSYGLLNPEIGKKYRKEIIGKGGSQEPEELLCNFLGREPNADAFFNELGV